MKSMLIMLCKDMFSQWVRLFLTGVGSALLAWTYGGVDETTVIFQAHGSAAAWFFRFFLRGDFGRLAADLARTCEGAVDLSCEVVM